MPYHKYMSFMCQCREQVVFDIYSPPSLDKGSLTIKHGRYTLGIFATKGLNLTNDPSNMRSATALTSIMSKSCKSNSLINQDCSSLYSETSSILRDLTIEWEKEADRPL